MKNKQTETKFKSALRDARHLFSRIVCSGAVSLICSSAPAQNLFVAANDGSGNIYEFTPAGQAEIEATGLPPSNNAESAVVQTLTPGNYTAIVRGKNKRSASR
jgi:hypothetical protein